MSLFNEIFNNPSEFYQQLSPDQQQAAAQQFQQQFAQSGDPQAQQWAQADPGQFGPAQLGEMHQYAQQQDPGMLQRVMDHPILDAALVGFGVHEYKKHEEERGY